VSYTAHTWVDREVITASKMNNIEEGINEASQTGGGGLTLIQASWDNELPGIVLSMTMQEIINGMLAGNLYLINTTGVIPEGWSFYESIFIINGIVKTDYNYYFSDVSGNLWTASTITDYPSLNCGD
jgi:hypothetical protein